MPISYRELRAAARRSERAVAATLNEADRGRVRTAFLCHSHYDEELARGFVALLADAGFDAYVDWLDDAMPSSPNRETARRLRARIASSDLFLFLATDRSVRSRWCPWEVGYADGVKAEDEIYVVPTSGDDGRSHGNEYLQLYRRLNWDQARRLRAYRPGRTDDGVLAAAL